MHQATGYRLGKAVRRSKVEQDQVLTSGFGEFQSPTCVVVKRTNPCVVASRDDILEAYRLAVKADPVSAFGGIVAFNIEVDEALAKEIREFRSPTDGETRMFYEIVVAPKYTKKVLD
ncbi:hypothetical protein PS2_009110 [Malus domestica]|uniref:Uncharacterized protein n=1 Tax=Malus domestica TaxID=3750 RepID=A0A498KNT8_MALDO|nr:hypothetical protein DVH24_032737 [Malus domestica]